MYLEKITSPADVKQLSIPQLSVLSDEVRSALLTKLSQNGGHIGPNLGMVEITIALHYVFDSPNDKMVYDVSHQSYIHKMLTGRKDAFLNPALYQSVSGYTNPKESEHDFFTVGHTSTSISLASGLAKARDLKQEKSNIIAVIGDGSLSGGEAYEGLNNVAEANTNFITIVNDNNISIGDNAGGLYTNLKALRESKGTLENNFFTSLGHDYYYVEDGHNLEQLIDTFKKVKDTKKPVVVHIYTIKGKGYPFAEQDKEPWHAGGPFDLAAGTRRLDDVQETYDSITSAFVEQQIRENSDVVAITSGTPGIFGFSKDTRVDLGKQFVDVGIAEEHAIAYTSAMASQNAKPIYAVYSTFLQRTYDQISQDLCLNNNPALVLVYLASVYGMSDNTHLGLFDMGLLSNIPNLVYLSPTSKEEYVAMLAWGTHQQDHPVFIRVPATQVRSTTIEDTTDYSILNKYKVIQTGEKVAIIAEGNFYEIGEQVVQHLQEKYNLQATLINPTYLSGIDETTLQSLHEKHSLVITVEDGVLEGGMGEKIARFYGPTPMKVKNYGFSKQFHDRYNVQTLLEEHRITVPQITEDILSLI